VSRRLVACWGAVFLSLALVPGCTVLGDADPATTVVTTPSDWTFGPYNDGDFVVIPSDVCPDRATRLEVRTTNDYNEGPDGEFDLSRAEPQQVQLSGLRGGPYRLSVVCRGPGLGPYLAYYEWEIEVLSDEVVP
jgi:hypothetical protein